MAVASTQPFNAAELEKIYNDRSENRDVWLGDRHYAVASIDASGQLGDTDPLLPVAVSDTVGCASEPLEPDDAGARRLSRCFGAVVLVLLISRAITGPLDSLVGAVRALADGNYRYALQPRGSAEMAEMGTAFNSMRLQLLELQRKQLEAERLAALGRAAGSISHDLRHQLAAVVANAEFLYNVDELNFDREEIYSEVRRGASQMTELIDSLVEISREKPSVVPVPSDLSKVVTKAAESVHASPDFRDISIEIREHGPTDGVFDPRKLERVFFNLLLNACEASANGNAGLLVESLPAESIWNAGSLTMEEAFRNRFARRCLSRSSVPEKPTAPDWAWPLPRRSWKTMAARYRWRKRRRKDRYSWCDSHAVLPHCQRSSQRRHPAGS